MSDYNNDQGDYDQRAANDAGYAAGRVEGEWNRAGDDVRKGVQNVEEFPEDVGRAATKKWDDGVQDVENAPSAAFDALKGAANWIGEKMGGAERDADRVGDYASNKYNDASNDVRDSYNDASNDVRGGYDRATNDAQQFGDQVGNSYDQGRQEGRQQGGW